MDAGFLSPLRVEEMREDRWILLAPLRYQSREMQALIVVPTGFVTDFASVPRLPFTFWLFGDTAHAAAVVHDYLYQTHLTATRAQADEVFAEAMAVEGVPAWRRGPMWLAVRMVGGGAWDSGPDRYTVLNSHVENAV